MATSNQTVVIFACYSFLYFYNYENMKTNSNNLQEARALAMLGGLAQESRIQLFRALVHAHSPVADEGGLAAGDLARQLDIPSPTLSFHLKAMSHAGLVSSRKIGRSKIYKANLDAMSQLISFLLDDCCDGCCDMTQLMSTQTSTQGVSS
jgi:ArsR family transcriptional regulator, arsenate/arsenite/antimonite-responsive transcriptional repressor